LNVSYDIVSDQTPTREGLCVYCGTARPISKPICPQCGRTWIDTKVGEEIPPLTPEIVAASSQEREALLEQQRAGVEEADRESRPWGLLVGAVIAAAAVAAIFFGIISGDGDGEDVAASTTQTTAAPGTTAATTTTTVATTTTPTTAGTTTSSTTTSTTTTTTIPSIEPEGAAIPIEDLTLGAFALGPFSFNADAAYLGRLVATLGQPDGRTEAGTDYGLCPDDDGVAYTWGALTAIFRIEGEREVLAGYRLDETGTDHPTQSITSRSGLQLGHTLEIVSGIYLQSGLAVEAIDGTPHFLLLRSTDDSTLLWGPVTSTEQSGTVEGIYSPQACDGGPRPSV
jgi:hypothetical protein